MKTSVIKIGNSKGIRIPAPVLKQCRIKNEVKLHIKGNEIILKPVQPESPREGWEDSFKKMADYKDDGLLIPDKIDLDSENWEW